MTSDQLVLYRKILGGAAVPFNATLSAPPVGHALQDSARLSGSEPS